MYVFKSSYSLVKIYLDRFSIQKKRIVYNRKTKIVYEITNSKIKEILKFKNETEFNNSKKWCKKIIRENKSIYKNK